MGSDCGDQRQWGKDFDPVEALLLLSPFSCWRMIEGPYKDFPEGDGRGRAGHSLVHLDQKKRQADEAVSNQFVHLAAISCNVEQCIAQHCRQK